jgi:uncharacterized protein (TIGR02246 family)
MKTTIALALLALAAAPAVARAGDKIDPKAAAAANSEAWAKAFNAHDPKAAARLYTDDVAYIFAFHGQEGKGKAAIEQFFAATFQQTPDIAVALQGCDGRLVGDGVLIAMCTWVDTFTGPDGKRATIPTQSSEIYTRQKGGGWRIRVEHASFAPPPPPAHK